jgi:hypothetical protein
MKVEFIEKNSMHVVMRYHRTPDNSYMKGLD